MKLVVFLCVWNRKETNDKGLILWKKEEEWVIYDRLFDNKTPYFLDVSEAEAILNISNWKSLELLHNIWCQKVEYTIVFIDSFPYPSCVSH